MPRMSKVELYAAIRRDHRGGMSMRELERKHGVTWRTVRKALDSSWPEPRKKLPPRATGLDRYKPAELLMAECDDRARRRSERRIKAAGFPREKSLRSFDFDANPNIDPATIHTLASCEWIKKSQPLCLIGDSGTGKSHMLIALGTEAAMKGYRVRYTLATKLVNELVEAADEKQLNKTIARYDRVDLLCIDELGYMELDRRGAELLFQVLTEREEKSSVAIASNESFGGWTKTFTDPRLCAAIVDRLTFNGTIIETGTDSYRLASTRARAEHAEAN
jgi:DNA replication protein DnaC